MGQKTHPVGIRLGITKPWASKWYGDKAHFAQYLNEDLEIRHMLKTRLKTAGVNYIEIERPVSSVKVTVYASRPGAIIGKKGNDIEALRKAVYKIAQLPVQLKIEQVRKPEIQANLVAENIAQQLERRVMFRRTIKRAMQAAQRHGIKGIKIMVSGRLGGAEIARTEWSREGRVPLHTFRADIDYGVASAQTTYGVVGVKVWIYKGEVGRGADKGAPDKERAPRRIKDAADKKK